MLKFSAKRSSLQSSSTRSRVIWPRQIYFMRIVLLICVLVAKPTESSVFSSLIRNNLNRYLKNPLFTRSFVRNSFWPNDEIEDQSVLRLGSNQHPFQEHPLINQFGTDSRSLNVPFSNIMFDLPSLDSPAPSIDPQNTKQRNKIPEMNQRYTVDKSEENVNLRSQQSVSYLLPENTNAYSDRRRINSLNSMNTITSTPPLKSSKRSNLNAENSYVNENNEGNNYGGDGDTMSFAESISQGSFYSNRNRNKSSTKISNANNQIENNLLNSSIKSAKKIKTNNVKHFKKMKYLSSFPSRDLNHQSDYNQEKALNLKLEYGFKPLPLRTEFLSTNSIQSQNDHENNRGDGHYNDDDDGNDDIGQRISSYNFDQIDQEDRDQDNFESVDDRDRFNDQLSSIFSIDGNENLFQQLSKFNRTMKSIESTLNNGHSSSPSSSNYLNTFASDYKKYINAPMETENSDIHKLAFTGGDSFRPDHSYYGGIESISNFGTIADYPNIRNFKQNGVECAQKSGYCEYDSSYPIDYINSIITNCTSIIDDMYAEMPEKVDDFTGYRSLFELGPDLFHQNNHSESKTERLCDSERKYIRPSVFKDVRNEFHLILQSSFYLQQIPVEICSNPGASCRSLDRCNSNLKCQQKYRMHLLISIDHNDGDQYLDYHSNSHHNHHHHGLQQSSQSSNQLMKQINCPKMRMYRLPSACVCDIQSNADKKSN
ncbi:hypothetical protein SSS_02171 [Sarcoptes scabiei]|uniref:Spaetzle domain-containing protein n=1 Tax=Sarcoptes scabiei TaxID=52283 RepID=A0A834RIT9_SARSC|nr:hypothetical protein SSS_02171 [Sarcoptes scabiei]